MDEIVIKVEAVRSWTVRTEWKRDAEVERVAEALINGPRERVRLVCYQPKSILIFFK